MTIVITEGPTSKTIGHTNYERHRRRQIAYGRWNRWTDPEPIREHILSLRRRGIGRDTLARQAGVTEHTIRRIVNRQGTKVHITCAQKLLAVTDPQLPYMDATGARRRLQALGVLGWDQSTMAERIGWSVTNLNLIVSGKRQQIVPATNDLIHRLYEELSGTVAPDSYRARRALMAAKRNGWVGPLAWDDDTIDDPDAQPNLGEVGEQSDDYDEITVALAVDGRLTHAQLIHHRPDLIETVRRLAQTMTDVEIAHHLHWPGCDDGPVGKTRGQNAIGKLRNRHDIPGPEKFEAVYAYRPGGRRARSTKAA